MTATAPFIMTSDAGYSHVANEYDSSAKIAMTYFTALSVNDVAMSSLGLSQLFRKVGPYPKTSVTVNAMTDNVTSLAVTQRTIAKRAPQRNSQSTI